MRQRVLKRAMKIKITQIKSAIGRKQNQKKVLTALGIHKMHQTVVHEDSPTIMGMVDKVKHLVTVEKQD
ncbi:MAG: 50S ribosomal protein L30 [candidate division Zixibacteria bacterium]|nr:50S ribosomal protein L30 [candidate division Zixibacteria bacterium]